MAENEDVDGPPKRSTRVLYLLARQADLLKALANRKGRTEEVDNRRAEMAARAEDRLTAYFSECLAHGADRSHGWWRLRAIIRLTCCVRANRQQLNWKRPSVLLNRPSIPNSLPLHPVKRSASMSVSISWILTGLRPCGALI